jgi:hypothetical protein
MEFEGIDAMAKPVMAFQDRLMLTGEVSMFLPFGLARGSAQSRGSPGNPAGRPPSRVTASFRIRSPAKTFTPTKGPDWFMTSCVVVG